MMKIHNTLTRQIDDFIPINTNLVRMYTCGPTVYDSAHIGNLLAYIYADVIRRTLNLAGYKVQHVINITDVDDKTIRSSRELYPELLPMAALKKLTGEMTEKYMTDMTAIGNNTSEVQFIRATDSIDAIKDLIQKLLDMKTAYVADDGIYFSISEYSKNRKYGQLSKVELPSQMKSRINNDEYDKDSVRDFALWKATANGEPTWDFEVDGKNIPGRPGWHIECSAMSVQSLGQPFDIHTGGIDHIFPHHENEIAQSTAGDQSERLANYFMHSAHLLVDGAKMSKSLGNFYTLDNLRQKGFGPLDFRMLTLQSHYQNVTNFTWQSLESAKNRLAAWRAAAELRFQSPDIDDDGQQTIVRNLLKQAADALLDNINTPEALKLVDQAINVVTENIANTSHEALKLIFYFTEKYLGLSIYDETPNLPEDLRDLITVRETKRASGDYATADEIRESLLSQGIVLRDTSIGVIWSR